MSAWRAAAAIGAGCVFGWLLGLAAVYVEICVIGAPEDWPV